MNRQRGGWSEAEGRCVYRYEDCGPRKAKLAHERQPVQTTIIARESVPDPSLAGIDSGPIGATA